MFKPLLAPNTDPLKDPDFFKRLKYPYLVSPKLDGIRCIVKDLHCKSRTFKDLPSNYVQAAFSYFNELDGEILVGHENVYDVYNRTQSYVMSEDKALGDYKLKFKVFDCADESLANEPFEFRLSHAGKLVKEYSEFFKLPDYAEVSLLLHYQVNNLEELLNYEEIALQGGYEGIMLRNPNGRYKHNRATINDNIIYKLKRFTDDEGIIIGLIEQETNLNKLETNELGYAKRSSSKNGLMKAGTLGKFIINYKGVELEIAPGNFNHSERLTIWLNEREYLGKVLKFRYFAHGIKDLPRFPRAIGFRDKMDI